MGNIKNYYAGSNSSLGFYSLYEEAVQGLEQLYILKGGPGTGKSTLIRHVGNAVAEKGESIEFLHCSSDNGSLDGVIIPSLKVGIVDGTAPHMMDPKYPGVIDDIVHLGDFRDDTKLEEHREDIVALTDKNKDAFSKAYAAFAEARNVHDDLEAIYLTAMDFQKADQVAEELIREIFSKTGEVEQVPAIKHRFFGAATPKGPVHFYGNLTEDVSKRYILKGRAGSGKSSMMKRIGKHAENKAYGVEYYYCAFDPESVDMVIIPALQIAILDGTDPHPFKPSRENDEVVDMFLRCMDPSIEEQKADAIRETDTSYKNWMKQGTHYLREAKKVHDELEKYYGQAMNFQPINRKAQELATEIINLIK
ncbi:hypothetical protein HUG15_21240 [Salicibibacter cibarius]|uniref:ATPase n=1 Tax=Salicibibacter cibarius TaxID=2743000 RepID=A0A7T6Z6I6_9BACI|nr:PRK06851 family protein [Salicibibacter cibarius]QQK77851.1 hypothetical protein HUG15_21240 [Salicibibacter cibarius]